MVKKLTSEKIIESIEKNKAKIRKGGVKKIGLFGSFIRKKQKSESDIDFLVEFEKINIDKYLYILNLLEKLFKKKIDLVIEQDLKPELEYVKKEAKYVKI